MTSSAWPCLKPDAQGAGCWLDVAVVPQARKTGIDGFHDGALRVRLVAPPVEGQANEALVAWLARQLGLPKRAVQLARGATSRRKQLRLDCPAQQVSAWLQTTLPTEPT